LVVRQIDGVVVKNDKTDLDGPDDPDGNAAGGRSGSRLRRRLEQGG